MGQLLNRSRAAVDRFLFESCSLATCGLFRIVYGTLLVIYVSIWLADGQRWFSDSGVMSAETARRVLDGPQWSLFFYIPATPTVVTGCLIVLLIQSICLLLGVFSRFQAACIFVWLLSFQHRNPLICDGEDTVFRLFAFFIVFIPVDAMWSVSSAWRSKGARQLSTAHAWGLRLIQIEIALIYFSAAWSKALGSTWRDGSALYYVYQMQDLFGRGWLPAWLTETEAVIRATTWGVVLVEAIVPLAIWWRPTRRIAIFSGIALHLSIEYSMHLFLFQWIMIAGFVAFLNADDWEALKRLFRRDKSADYSSPKQPLTS